MRVHFICRGNAYRSLLAEAYFKARSKDVTSSGVLADLYKDQNKPVIKSTRDFIRSKDLPTPSKHAPVQLTAKLLRPDDMVICINQKVFTDLSRIFKTPPHLEIWDIADFDEVGGGLDAKMSRSEYTEIIYKQITKNVDQLLERLKQVAK